MVNRKGHPASNKLTIVLFTIYLAALFWILLFKLGVHFSYMEKRNVNLIPFRSLLSGGKISLSEIIPNTAVFIPLGIYAGVLFNRWSWGWKFFFFFLLSVIIEALQFSIKIGAFDSTDIITNLSGAIIGLMIFEITEKLFNNSVSSQKFMNIVAATGTILMVTLLLLLKLNMLPVRYQ